MAKRTKSPLSVASPSVLGMQQLDDRDQDLLDFERHIWKYQGTKETAIRERFDMSPTRYYQALNHLIDQPAAMAHDPMLVKRLQRLRAQRAARRAMARASFNA